MTYYVIYEHLPEETYIYRYVGDDPSTIEMMLSCQGLVMNATGGLLASQEEFMVSLSEGNRLDFVEEWSTVDDAVEKIPVFEGPTQLIWMAFAL